MKKGYLTLIFVATIALFAACRGPISLEGLTNEEALKVLDSRIKKDKDNADLYFQRGKILLEMGKQQNDKNYITSAIKDFEAAIELDDENIDYYIALGDAYFSRGDFGNSYSALQKALKIDENNFDASLKMGEIAFYSKDYDLAMENLNKVTAKDKNNTTALFMKGFIYKEIGDTANAVTLFRKVIDLHPDYEPAYEELGLLYAQYKNKLAVEYLNTALTLEPQNINVLYGLAMLYQELEDADLANEYYVKILEIDPNNKYAWYNRGWMELVLYEDYQSAIEFFTKAIECDNRYADAYYNCGVAYENLGEKAKAKQYYDETLAIDPKYEKLNK